MKKLSYLILTFLFLVTGALPLFARTVIYPSDSDELRKELCKLRCYRQSYTWNEYIACVTNCADWEVADQQSNAITEFIEKFLDDSLENLEESLDNWDTSDTAPLLGISEIQCKLRCELEYRECRDDHGLQQGIRPCITERKECRKACESESSNQGDAEDAENDNDDLSDYWHGE